MVETTMEGHTGDLIEIGDWLDSVKSKAFIDYDGFGYAVKDGNLLSTVRVWPSRASEISKEATHILWFNR